MTPPKKKATAPKPKVGGYDAAKERQERAKQTFRVTVKDSDISFTYRPYGIPIRVRAFVREHVGMTLDQMLFATGTLDVQTMVDMWWISRLCDGDTGGNGKPITRAVVQDEFDELCPGAIYDDFVQEDITDEVDDSPKA